MRKILLATVAAVPLLAVGMMPASSQDINKQPGKQGVSQPQGQAGAKEQRAAPQGREAQGRPEPATQGRAESTPKLNQTSDRQEKAQGKSEAKSEAKPQQKTEGQPSKAGNEKQADQAKAKPDIKQGQAEQRTTGQAAKGKGKESAEKQPAQKEFPRTSGQATRPETGGAQQNNAQQNKPQQNNAQQNNAQQNNRGQQGGQIENRGAENRGREAGGRVTINEEQRTKIRQSVFAGRDVPRLDRVNFTIDIGVAVPREVRVVEVPAMLIEINPQWRGDEFFVVEDDIIIIDRSRVIVARVPVGSSSAATVETRTTTIVDLDEADIRRVQEVLIEKGFFHGRVDGVLSPEFKEAVIKFQEREGIEANGRIDERTSVALGVSVRTQGRANENERNEKGQVGQKAGQPEPKGSTSGQAGGQNKDEKAGQANRPAPAGDNKAQGNRPATSGQGGNRPSADENKASGPQGGTSGQSMKRQNPNSGEDQRKR